MRFFLSLSRRQSISSLPLSFCRTIPSGTRLMLVHSQLDPIKWGEDQHQEQGAGRN